MSGSYGRVNDREAAYRGMGWRSQSRQAPQKDFPTGAERDIFPARTCTLNRIKLSIYGLGNPSIEGSSDVILNVG